MLAHELLERGKERNPNKTYLNFEGTEYTYSAFDDRVSQSANTLRELDVSKGERVGTLLPNCPEHVGLVFACSKIGAVFTPNNPELKPEALTHQLSLSEPEILITTTELADTAEQAVADTDDGPDIVTLELFRSQRSDQSRSIDPLEYSDQEPLVHIYTSGTTGPPKACELKHCTWTEAAINFADRIGFAPADNVASAHPLHHAIWWPTCLAPCAAGATTVIFERFSSSNWWDWMREHDVSVFFAVGGLLRMLENLPESEDDTNNPVDLIYTKEIRPEVEERYDVRLVSGYGLSESPFITMNPPDPKRRKEDSIGFPSPKKQMKIVDEDGNEVPRGETGEIITKSPYLMKGYYNEPEKTDAAFEDGWFYTGDLGKRDEEGYFYFVDRKKHIIRRSGQNISSEEIEEIINRVPEIDNVAVIPAPHDVRGEVIKAVVKLKAGRETTPEAIFEHCQEHLSEYKWPRYIELVDTLPTSSTERVQKGVLEEREEETDPNHWDRTEHESA
ncbi:class I adenylate-forming enzyme family protein [Natronorubrum sp. FCH18a]|uniref:class I adenylate-forming enzyme family protein n=1 Tax=Natronorubrum sp. FCH18a TaxID=3447018 RepID=UPI003F51668A